LKKKSWPTDPVKVRGDAAGIRMCKLTECFVLIPNIVSVGIRLCGNYAGHLREYLRSDRDRPPRVGIASSTNNRYFENRLLEYLVWSL